MFLYFVCLTVYFRIFIFLLNENNLWHWRIPAQGILQEIVAAGVFYLSFRVLFLLIRNQLTRKVLFFAFVTVWTVINFANYEYADTFNRLLPLSWFPELMNASSMGSFSEVAAGYMNLHTLFLLGVPLLTTLLILFFKGNSLFELKKKRHLVYVFLFTSACQSATLDPGIQPEWDSIAHSHMLKYWYYKQDAMPRYTERLEPLPEFSPAFKELVIEDIADKSLILPKVEQSKPNVVLIFLESFRSHEIGVFGSNLGITPNFDRFAKKGVLFTNIYSSDYLTKSGQWSYLCGAHKHKGGNVLTFYKDHAAKCLPDVFSENGYDNWWFHGQAASYDFQGYFMKRHKVNHIMDRLTFPIGIKPMGWGLADKDLMDHALNHLSESKEPFFWMVQSQSNHHPYAAPPEFVKDRGYPETINKFLNTFEYTDYTLGYFLDRFLETPQGKNSLIAIMADHGSSKSLAEPERAIKKADLDFAHIPVLLLYPQGQKIKPRQLNTLGGQADVMPTLLDILNIPIDFPIMGKSLAREYKHRYAKTMLSSGSWIRVGDEIHYANPSKPKISLNGEGKNNALGEYNYRKLISEIDNVQDWIISQTNRNTIHEGLINNGWTRF